MSLFHIGAFKLASGQTSLWKLDCDILTDDDWKCLAALACAWQRHLPDFGSVIGVPRGGVPFAKALEPYATIGPRLVADDVFTTGGSLRKIMRDDDLAIVAFARTKPPPWLHYVWVLS